MCQLLGMSCKEPATINFSLEGFQARGGLTDEHKDGWGIAFFEDQGCRVFLDHQPASTSPLVQAIKALHIKSRTVIAHIRKATFGEVSLRNCHPFQRELWGQTWIFSHNGDLHSFHPEAGERFTPQGETDSERAFCFLMDALVKRFPHATSSRRPNDDELYAALQQISETISAYGSFNILLSNGDILFTHCSTHLSYVERDYPFTHVTLVDCDISLDLNTHNSHADRMVIIATKPLTRNEPWVICKPGETFMFRNGVQIAHGHRAPRPAISVSGVTPVDFIQNDFVIV
jgi:predicted glutamine amidotransferase